MSVPDIGMSRTSGAQLSGDDHLAQSVGDILTTPIGTRPMRRDYGSMLFELIDQPLNSATRLLVFAATASALRRWEPRLKVERVGLVADPDQPGQAAITLEALRAVEPAANSLVTLTIPIPGLSAGAALAN